MRTSLAYGRGRFEVEIPEERLVRLHQSLRGAPVSDLNAALLNALENPFEFPALRGALTPDDHITIAVDEKLPQLVPLLVALLDYLKQTGIHPDAVTLLCRASSSGQPWLEVLPDAFQDVHVEIHQPGDRKKLSYLATTKEEKRAYLNRTAVDADQLIVLAQRTFDCVMGYGGGAGEVYPWLSNNETLKELASQLSRDPPASRIWPLQQQAAEICWLLGSPFFIQVVAGTEGSIQHLMAGPVASVKEGERLLEATWHVEADRAAELVLATIHGDGDHLAFHDVAQAFLAASRIVRPGGNIVVLADGILVQGKEAQLMKGSKDPVKAFQLMLHDAAIDLQAAFAWTSAANQAKLFLRSRATPDAVIGLFIQPISDDEQIRQLIAAADSVAVLPDANQCMAIVNHATK